MTAGMLKYGEAVTDWMRIICNLAWMEEKVPGDSTKVTVVPVYKKNLDRNEH